MPQPEIYHPQVVGKSNKRLRRLESEYYNRKVEVSRPTTEAGNIARTAKTFKHLPPEWQKEAEEEIQDNLAEADKEKKDN